MSLYRVFGTTLSEIFVKASCAEEALHKARKLNENYCVVQRIDDLVIKTYNLKIREDEIIE